MDPFVTQIGDVTIQRVGVKDNSPQDLKDEPPSDEITPKMEGSSVSPDPEKGPSSCTEAEDKPVKDPDTKSVDESVKTEPPLEESEKGSVEKDKEESVGVKDKKDVRDDITESFPAMKDEGEQDKDDEGDRDGDEGDREGDEGDREGDEETEMDASRFLEMAQSEGAEIADSGEGVIPPGLQSLVSSKISEEEGLDEEEESDEMVGDEEGRRSDGKGKSRRVRSNSQLDPADDEDMQDENNVNGAMDSSYAEQDYDDMEAEDLARDDLDDMAAVKEENDVNEYDDDDAAAEGQPLIKSEPVEDPDRMGEEEGDGQQGGSDIKKKLRTRQKRKILKEDDTDESEEERKKKRKKRKKKGAKGDDSDTSEETESEDDGSGKKKKKKKKTTKKTKKKDDDDDGSGGEKEKKSSNMRRNIRDVMDETQLDEATLAAQRQEMERLRRVQEQQRALREMAHQRQQQQRAERAEHKVMSLLQGNTSILKQVTVGPSQSSKSGTSGSANTVVVKVGSGVTAQSNKKVLELLRVPKGSSDMKPSVTKTLLSKPQSLQGTTMMTPSVSIAPVRTGPAAQRPGGGSGPSAKIPSMIQAQASYSASEGEEELEDEEEEEELGEELLDEEGKKKKKDVVTISSSSEDDCIVLSEPSDIGEDEEEEDPTNSGMHTNDMYNVPDDEGRVQVNMGKPEGDPDIFLAPHIARIIKPHQIGGIRFLFDNIIESIERFNTSTGFGCILAHSMGLGKTLQVITFCDVFLRHTPAKTVMCIMPINTLQNWLAEFNMWMPDDPLATPLAAQGEVRPRTFNIHVLNDSHKTLKSRAKVVEDWTTGGGVLLIGYEMYRQLSLKKVGKPKRSRRKRATSEDEELDAEEEEKRQKEILEKVFEALVKPGPDLVICDEGHRIKNSHASISIALKQIRSKRRVVLTGYPLQNNLLEYWCMVDFVRPNYLGTKTEFCNMFERPIQNGQCIDSTPQDIRLMRYRAHVLHSLLEGFVQRRSHAVLTNALPQKEEFVLLVRLTPFQRKLYDTFMNEVVRTKAVPNPLKAFAVCCKIWNHPDVLYQFLKKREGGEGVDLDLEEAAAALAANTVTDPTGTPIEERKAAAKGRSRGGGVGKGRKKKETSPNKPAAAVLPNSSNQSDPYNLSSQYPVHGQMNSNSMMGSYNPYNTSGHQSYGSFNSPHHYNPSGSYGHSGYSGAPGFNSNSSNLGLNAAGQASFSGSGSSGYGDSLASSPASQSSQYGSSSSQSMFNNSSSSNPSSSTTPGYGSMGPPYFSGTSPSASGQHSMTDGFSSSSNYSQSWSGSNSYNSFNQGPSGSQSFSGSSYGSSGQNPSFPGYGGSGSSSFNQSMYGSGSGSSAPSGSASQNYQPGLLDQQMLDQNLMAPPNRPNLVPQPSPVNASGMLPGGARMTAPSKLNRVSVNSSGRLPGGAPTKNPAMMPPTMMGMENMMGHHSMSNMFPMNMAGQAANPNPNAPPAGPMATLSSMASADVPPSAEDLLRAASDDFGTAFDSSIGKTEANRGMYDVKDRNMFDPWGGSHGQPQPQDFNMDLKAMPEKAEAEVGQLKSDAEGVKMEGKPGSDFESKEMGLSNDSIGDGLPKQDVEAAESTESWRVDSMEIADKDKEGLEDDKEKEGKEEEDDGALPADGKIAPETPATVKTSGREDPGIPYDWAVELMKDYVPGLIENSAKMVLFFCVLEEALAIGDRILLFSQSLFTLSLLEDYLQRSYIPVPGVYERWQRNRTYFRLDGSTAAMEREKLINEFNANPNVYLFLVSTRAGSLGINLVGANRVIVFDASWNPCHDTQAVCRVYRYGQKKPCYVYRFVMDNCLEKKIYDRQINKQGMSDRVVDECNPDAHLSIKEVTNLCWDDEKESEVKDLSSERDNYTDVAMQKVVEKYGKMLTKAPFQHESLLVDRKDKKLSQAEKRLAKRSYEMEKRAANRPPVYNYYNPGQGGLQIRPIQRDAAGNVIKPIASVRPMQADGNSLATGNKNTKWIPAEVWQRQGMSAQEMTLPLDVVIPTNSPERSSIVLKAGQRVMVLKSPKGIYMQLENGKIIAIRTAFKMGANNKTENKPFAVDKDDIRKGVNTGIANKGNIKLTSGIHPLRNNPNITITPRGATGPMRGGIRPNIINRPGAVRMQTSANMRPWVRPGGVAGRAVPLRPGQNLRPGIRGLSPSVTVTPANAKPRNIGPVTITPRLAPANFPGMKTPVDGSKDKVKDLKSDLKGAPLDKLESDDGQSSNSSADAPSNSSKTSGLAMSPSIEEKSDKEKDGLLITKEDSQALALDKTKSFEGSMSENLSTNSLSVSNHNIQDKSLNLSDPALKNYHLPSSQRQQDMNKMSGQDSRDPAFSGSSLYSSSEKTQSSSMPFQGSYSGSSAVNKSYSSSGQGGNLMSPPSYNTAADDSKSSTSVENQWKSPSAAQVFSPGVSSNKSSSQQRSLESPAYDDSSNASVHSNVSNKSASAHGSSLETRPQPTVDPGLVYGTDLSKSSKTPSASATSGSSHSSSSSSKSNPPSSGTSSSIPTSSSSSNFSALDPYTNLYSSYGAYPGGLPSSNYYNPYSYPPGFLPDPKSSLPGKSSTETNQSAAAAAPPPRSSSKSSSRTESRKNSHESSRSSLSSSYEGRQSSSSSTTTTSSSSHRGSSSSTSSSSAAAASAAPSSSSTSADPAAYSSSAAAAAAAYNPMMMSPSFNPTSCQYPPPATASGSTNPFTAAAAAAATYPSPYGYPGYPGVAGANQFESDLARAQASMYSAFHRPEAGLDPTSPYLAALPAHSRPMTGAAAAAASASSFYSQNVYGSQYGAGRDPYAQLPPYPASPLFMPPAPYSGLSSSASSTATSDQSPSQ